MKWIDDWRTRRELKREEAAAREREAERERRLRAEEIARSRGLDGILWTKEFHLEEDGISFVSYEIKSHMYEGLHIEESREKCLSEPLPKKYVAESKKYAAKSKKSRQSNFRIEDLFTEDVETDDAVDEKQFLYDAETGLSVAEESVAEDEIAATSMADAMPAAMSKKQSSAKSTLPAAFEEAMMSAMSEISLKKSITIDIEDLIEAGVPMYIIEKILLRKKKLTSIRITSSFRILAEDYKVEVKMPPLDKALYLFYLRHPEGVRFKDLSDHKTELIDLYASLTTAGDMADIVSSVDALVNPFNNSVNEKCSRIKRAFVRLLGEDLAKHYYIAGPSGEAKSIGLDRDLVRWD